MYVYYDAARITQAFVVAKNRIEGLDTWRCTEAVREIRILIRNESSTYTCISLLV